MLVVLIISCNKTPPENSNDNLILATLYNYYSAEYEALTFQAYNIAEERLINIKKERPAETNFAIVLDIDETILNNSPYQAKLIHENIFYDSCWNDWCNAALATTIPGAQNFLNLADSLGFHIFYISNRKEKFVKEGTVKNMKENGLPQVTDEHFLLRTTERSKTSRRSQIEKDYEIVMLLGDNLGDFFEDAASPSDRSAQVTDLQKEFGNRFIVLPNAMYGNWVDALKINGNPEIVDSLMVEMIGGEW